MLTELRGRHSFDFTLQSNLNLLCRGKHACIFTLLSHFRFDSDYNDCNCTYSMYMYFVVDLGLWLGTWYSTHWYISVLSSVLFCTALLFPNHLIPIFASVILIDDSKRRCTTVRQGRKLLDGFHTVSLYNFGGADWLQG